MAGLPTCRATENLVVVQGDYSAMNRSALALWTAKDCGMKSSSGKALPADSSQESPICCDCNVSAIAHLVCMYF